MADPLTLPESVVDGFARHDPSEQDVKSVTDALQDLLRNPNSGVPIPFTSAKYRGIYATWTPDKKWRIVFRPRTPNGFDVFSIDPEPGFRDAVQRTPVRRLGKDFETSQ